jgi:hypothetical protein
MVTNTEITNKRRAKTLTCVLPYCKDKIILTLCCEAAVGAELAVWRSPCFNYRVVDRSTGFYSLYRGTDAWGRERWLHCGDTVEGCCYKTLNVACEALALQYEADREVKALLAKYAAEARKLKAKQIDASFKVKKALQQEALAKVEADKLVADAAEAVKVAQEKADKLLAGAKAETRKAYPKKAGPKLAEGTTPPPKKPTKGKAKPKPAKKAAPKKTLKMTTKKKPGRPASKTKKRAA